jgi:hypothetical protein
MAHSIRTTKDTQKRIFKMETKSLISDINTALKSEPFLYDNLDSTQELIRGLLIQFKKLLESKEV